MKQKHRKARSRSKGQQPQAPAPRRKSRSRSSTYWPLWKCAAFFGPILLGLAAFLRSGADVAKIFDVFRPKASAIPVTTYSNSGSGSQFNNSGSGHQFIGATPTEVATLALDAEARGFKRGMAQVTAALKSTPTDSDGLYRRLEASYPDGYGIYWSNAKPITTKVSEAFRRQNMSLDLNDITLEWLPRLEMDRHSLQDSFPEPIPYVTFKKMIFGSNRITDGRVSLPAAGQTAKFIGWGDVSIFVETLARTTNGIAFAVGLRVDGKR